MAKQPIKTPAKSTAPKAPSKKVVKPSIKPEAKAAPAAIAPSEPVAAPPGRTTKLSTLLDLLRRPEGVTITEVSNELGWQAHSVRGALSGTVGKKLGYTLTNETVEGRGRVYRIAA